MQNLGQSEFVSRGLQGDPEQFRAIVGDSFLQAATRVKEARANVRAWNQLAQAYCPELPSEAGPRGRGKASSQP